ncbi:MAG: glycosyltransferase family 9 protein [Bacteroidia bacterium]
MIAPERVLFFFSWLANGWINLFKRPLAKVPKRILVIRLDELGDMVTTMPVFEALKSNYPDAEISLLCKPLMARLVANCPHIDRVLTDWSEVQGRFSYIADLRGNWKSLRFALLHRAYRVDRGSHRFVNRLFKRDQGHEVDFNLHIIRPLLRKPLQGIAPRLYPSRRNVQQADLFLQRLLIGDFVVFHTGARKLLRRWSLQKWAELAVFLYQRHELQIVFAGGPEDEADIAKIQKKLPFETYSFAGKGDLLDYAALVGKARFMVGNESGPMHIAAAMNVPVLALFGPGQPEIFAPYGKQNKFLHVKLPCNPCDQLSCIHPNNPCINRIEVQDVLREVLTFLN